MKQYGYVIVLTDGSSCWSRWLGQSTDDEENDWDEGNLAQLLQEGWRPVREAPMGGNIDYAATLILLEREV